LADVNPQSVSEAVQPSFWDRLVDDLPGLAAETDKRISELRKELGADRVDRLLAGGRRALEQEPDLDRDERADFHQVLGMLERRAFLEQRGIVVTPAVLREAVRRDIEALFNIERHESHLLLSDRERTGTEEPAERLADFPQVRRSVVNYGVPAFSGHRANDFDADELARELKEVIATFEPRFKRDTIRVTVDTSSKKGLVVAIDGLLLLSPVPERMRLSTTIDLDSGRAMTALEDA
jgi:type VI secretion system protein ImpF